MSVFLLDVNVLLALSWPGHQSHRTAQQWFARNAARGWATCPLVETGFVRISSNPAFSPQAVSPAEAVEALRISVQHPSHQFWADDEQVTSALAIVKGRLVGHEQVTDAYLLALAIRHKGRLATLDKGVSDLAAEGSRERAHLEIIV